MRVFLTVFAVLLATTAHAQEAANFEQIHNVLTPGQPVVLTATSGSILRGRVLDVSSSALALSVDGQRREYSSDEVLKITTRRHGSVAKGVAWGAGIGTGLGLFGIVAAGGSDCGQCLTGTLLAFTGIGSGIGAAVAASTFSDHLVFVKTNGSGRLSVTPVMGPRAKGAMLSVRW